MALIALSFVGPALVAGRSRKVPVLLLLAIGHLESGHYNRMPLGSKNPFGMKYRSRHAFKVHAATKEGADLHDSVEAFAGYDSYQDAFNDLAWLLSVNGTYKAAIAGWYDRGVPRSWTKWHRMLAHIGSAYAGDPEWANKVYNSSRTVANALRDYQGSGNA